MTQVLKSDKSFTFKLYPVGSVQSATQPVTAGSQCEPDITGIFFPNPSNPSEFDAVSHEIRIRFDNGPAPDINIPTFVPIQIVGNTCGKEVEWVASWEAVLGEISAAPILFGNNSGAVIGWNIPDAWSSSNWEALARIEMPPGELTVTAIIDGVEYGPITLTIVYDERYS